jgi:hypothetical protein
MITQSSEAEKRIIVANYMPEMVSDLPYDFKKMV